MNAEATLGEFYEVKAGDTIKSCPPTRETLEARYPEATILYGWGLGGPGPSRHGWWALHPGGYRQFLGRTLVDVQRRDLEP